MPFDIIAILVSAAAIFGIYGIVSLSLNLDFGYAGQPNLGKVIPWAIGAITIGVWSSLILQKLFIPQYGIHIPVAAGLRIQIVTQHPMIFLAIFLSGAVLAVVLAMAVGWGLSYPAIRARADYLALILLFAAEVMRVFLRDYYPLLGGPPGMIGVPQPFLFVKDPELSQALFALTILAAFATCYVYTHGLCNSPYGRVLKAIRDDEVAALSLGKNVRMLKGQVLAISSGMAAIGGVLYGCLIGSVVPDDFAMSKTFDVWLIVVIGGIANNKGVFYGTIMMVALDRITRILVFFLPNTALDPNVLRYILYGVIFLLFLRYRPRGLAAEKPLDLPSGEVILKHERAKSK
jgi:branched-chain amino acid transport system permease protein